MITARGQANTSVEWSCGYLLKEGDFQLCMADFLYVHLPLYGGGGGGVWNQLARVICFQTHWLERNISSETLISGQMFTIKMQFWFHSSPILPPCISARSGEETRVSREGRSGVTAVGSAARQFAMRVLRCIEWQGWGTGLFLQLNLVPQAMNKSWVNRNPEAERRTAHTDSTWGWRTTVPEGLGVFSSV